MNKNGGAKGSFIRNNTGGLVVAALLVIVTDIFAIGRGASGGFIAVSILFIPLLFIACVIGNTIRKAVHPDFVVASGFWGLVKERIFWKIGPQAILMLIVWAIAFNAAEGMVKRNAAQAGANRFSKNIKESNGGSLQNQTRYFELTKDAFIQIYAEGNEFVETDVERAPTMIKRGNRYLKITGDVTKPLQFRAIFVATYLTAQENHEEFFLDFSDTRGFAIFGAEETISGVSSIILGDEFTEVKGYIFGSGSSVKSVFIPHTVTQIGNNAFYNLNELPGVIIPPLVTEIGVTAFASCDNLSFVYFSEKSLLKKIGTQAFYGTQLDNIDFPPQLEIVGHEAFFNTKITSLVFPASIKEIGSKVAGDTLKTVVINAVTPPKVDADTFPKTIEKIHVPAESLKTYEDAWFDYEFTFNNQLTAFQE